MKWASNPRSRNNICLNSHPKGCQAAVKSQIAYVTKELAGGLATLAATTKAKEGAPKLVLVVGCSTGYGLASRIAAGFGYGAATVGVSYEKAGSTCQTGHPRLVRQPGL
ncbi:hypothetical protein MASR2M78_10110 [Treponema sp.]